MRKLLGSSSQIVLGMASTGVKFTPGNHRATGDKIPDIISSGDLIPTLLEEMAAEARSAHEMGVRYIHIHARNPASREQRAELDLYRAYGREIAWNAPGALLSYGASRNGPEIRAAIDTGGELARIRQAGLALGDGGTHFVTAQAAIELQIVTDLERLGFVRIDHEAGKYEILRPLSAYKPSKRVGEVDLDVHSTAGGGVYGASSAKVQMDTLRWVIDRRVALGLPFEVEWVQGVRSPLLTHSLANIMPDGIRRIGRLNITILFGFSARLPFPEDYAEFREMVRKAHAIGDPQPGATGNLARRLDVSVAVGAAVLPQHGARHIRPVDVGPDAGRLAGPTERLVHWACQPDSGVDIVRVGMEDAPCHLDSRGILLPGSNLGLVARARDIIERNDVSLVTEASRLEEFARVPQV